jgi:hypothetical protein
MRPGILAVSGSPRRGPCSQKLVSLRFEQRLACSDFGEHQDVPACPNCVDVHALGDIDNQLHIGVVVVVSAARDFDIVVCHSDVICVGLQIFRSGHDGELNGALVAESLVSPFSDRSNFLDGSNAVVGDQNLCAAGWSASLSWGQGALGHASGARVCATRSSVWVREILTFVMTVCPSFAITKSFTFESLAFSTLLPPMKWSAIWCSSAYDCLLLLCGTTTPPRGALLVISVIMKGGRV